MNTRKGILMLCYYYPPIKSMGVMRSYALSHQWLQHFKSVSVLTTNNNTRLYSEPLPLDKRIKLVSISTFDYRTITSLFSPKSHYAESSKKSWFGQFAVKLLNSFPFNLWIGEGGYWYVRNAYLQAIREIENNDIGYVYSSFRPYSDHAIAARLKRRFPHLVWLADFRDIHIDVLKQNVFLTSYQHRMNRRILKTANAVTTVSNGCADHIRNHYPKVDVIYNGIDVNSQNSSILLNQRFTMSYTGSLYGNMRNPSLVFEALRELSNEGELSSGIQVVYAGKDGDTWDKWIKQYGLDQMNLNEGLCTHVRAQELQRKSHINLQLTFAHPEVTGAITGKVMEYVRAGRPILCLVNGSRDMEIETFFDRVEGSIVVYNRQSDKDIVKDYILEYYRLYLAEDDLSFDLNQPILEELNWPYLANKFVQTVDNIENEG